MATNNSINNKARLLTVLPTATGAGNAAEIRLRELAASGTNYVSLKSPDSLAGDTPYTLPDAYPSISGQVLSSTTAGVMSWATATGGNALGDNVIINPEMIIAQRGTSFAGLGTGSANTLDRWQFAASGTMVYTISQSTTVPTVSDADYLFTNSILGTVTTVDTTIGAGDGHYIAQKVEGYNFKSLAQQDMTISFWVRSSLTGTYCVAFINSGADRSYVAEYTISVANTWEKKTVTITASPSAGTWNYTNGIGSFVIFTLSGGSNVQTTPGAWQTGNFYSTSNQVNHSATISNTFYLTGVKLENGTSATDFKGRNIGAEIELCQRYFQKTFNLTTTPASSTESGLRASGVSTAAAAATSVLTGFSFPTRMRATPTIVTYNPFAAGNQIANAGGTSTNTTLFTASPTSISFTFTVPAGGAVGSNYGVHYTAESEL